jgi:L-ribulose-5-phosphate 3-epimerase
MLGEEMMEGSNVVDSIGRAICQLEALNSPWFQPYPDIGELAAYGINVGEALDSGHGHNVGIHVEDSRPGEPRHSRWR